MLLYPLVWSKGFFLLPCSSSLIRSSMCWWWLQPLSTSMGCPTCRNSVTAWKGGAQMTLCSESAWF